MIPAYIAFGLRCDEIQFIVLRRYECQEERDAFAAPAAHARYYHDRQRASRDGIGLKHIAGRSATRAAPIIF